MLYTAKEKAANQQKIKHTQNEITYTNKQSETNKY